jgi:hypothetical protein
LACGKRVDCGIIRHFLTLPSSFQLFEREWGEDALFHRSASTCRFFCNRRPDLGPQIWAVEKRPSELVFRPGIRFSIAVFHW